VVNFTWITFCFACL